MDSISSIISTKNVYNSIAEHFSDTRYSVWGSIKAFTDTIPDYSLVADVGCGNGKNILRNTNIFTTGFDLSLNLLECARCNLVKCHSDTNSFVCCNCTNIPSRSNMFDYSLCVAMLHHLPNIDLRLQCIYEIYRITKPNGMIFIHVWAFEDNKHANKDGTQDTAIKWHKKGSVDIYTRYYYLFKKGELDNYIELCNNKYNIKLKIIKSGLDFGNYYYWIQKQ
jgi:tRNA (uracil-5-)-methyltransferase TRM9